MQLCPKFLSLPRDPGLARWSDTSRTLAPYSSWRPRGQAAPGRGQSPWVGAGTGFWNPGGLSICRKILFRDPLLEPSFSPFA